LTEKNFRPASAFTLFCVEVQMLHHHQSYRSLNNNCASVYIVVGCDAVSVFSAEHIYCIAEVQDGALSVLMPLNSGMPDVLQELHGLLRTWSVRLHRRPMCNAFFVCGLLHSGR